MFSDPSVLSLFLMNFSLLNERYPEQFVTISTKYIRTIISTFGNVPATPLFINSLYTKCSLENERRKLQTAQIQHQGFDLDHPCTQQTILLQLLRFYSSLVIPVHTRNRKENRCFRRLPDRFSNEFRN